MDCANNGIAFRILDVIDAIPWNKFPRLTAMLKKVTKKEM
jgi:hypothetical protein